MIDGRKVHIQVNELKYLRFTNKIVPRFQLNLNQHKQIPQPRRINLLILHRQINTRHHPVLKAKLPFQNHFNRDFPQRKRLKESLTFQFEHVMGFRCDVIKLFQ